MVAFSAKVAVFELSGFIRANVIVFGQGGCIRAKDVVIRAKVVVFEAKVVCLRTKWLY